jgi:3-phosphoshikimate 1-carboxyvinyltransferase
MIHIPIPPSKSHSIRAILFAGLAHGTSTIHNLLPSPDIDAAIELIQHFGAEAHWSDKSIFITGFDGKPTTPADVINAGNSGLVYRFGTALSALCKEHTIITGDESIRTRRPIEPLLKALQQLGATAFSARNNGTAPVVVSGLINPGKCEIEAADSQPLSALLITTPFSKGATTIQVHNMGERPWVELTLDWLRKMKIDFEIHPNDTFIMAGHARLEPFEYTVAGDYSSAAFPAAAALISKTNVLLEGLDPDDVQGDKALFSILEQMGANISWCSRGMIINGTNSMLNGIDIDINPCIDALPILATLACFANGKTVIYNGAIARLKESDRIHSIAQELNKLGARISKRADGLEIEGSKLHGGTVLSHHDHRIAMSLLIAGLDNEGVRVDDCKCIEKSYPNFGSMINMIKNRC